MLNESPTLKGCETTDRPTKQKLARQEVQRCSRHRTMPGLLSAVVRPGPQQPNLLAAVTVTPERASAGTSNTRPRARPHGAGPGWTRWARSTSAQANGAAGAGSPCGSGCDGLGLRPMASRQRGRRGGGAGGRVANGRRDQRSSQVPPPAPIGHSPPSTATPLAGAQVSHSR